MEELSLSFNLDNIGKTKVSDLETIKDGTSFYRPLPPFGTNNGGSPFAFHGIHWGFKDDRGNDVPVRCSYDKEKFCPVCVKVWDTEKLLKEDEENSALSADERQQLEEFVSRYRADKAYYTNAVTPEGVVKKLKIKPVLITGSRQEKEGAFVRKIKEAASEKKFDPISIDTGAWFKFTRAGKGFSTSYDVDFKRTTRKEGNRIIEEIDTTPLSEQFPELYAVIKNQLATGEKGPLFDVHTLYAPRTSVELKRFLDGAAVPSFKKEANQTLAVGSLTPLAAPVAPVAVAPPVPVPALVVAETPVVAQVAAVSAPVVVAEAAKPTETKVADTAAVDKVAEQRARLKALGILK